MLDTQHTKFSPRTIMLGLTGLGLLGGIIAFTVMSDGSNAQAAGDSDKPKAQGARLPQVTVLTPGTSQISNTIKVTGTISAQYDMPVSVEGEGGRVAAVLVEAGDVVKKGQVMARINTDVLRPYVAQLAAALDEAKADARLASAEYDRVKAVSGSGAISREDVERRAAAAEMRIARAKVAEAQLREAEARLARADVRAPADGLVLERTVEVGQAATQGGVLFRIAKDGKIELRGEVAEQDMPPLKVGQTATVRISGTEREFAGKVWLLSPTIDPKTRLGMVRVALSPDPLLRPGAFANGFVVAGEAKRPVLPHSALQADAKGAFVYVVGAENKAVRRAVRVGTTIDKGVVIEEGLTGQERVVAVAGAFLRDGEVIAPIAQQAS